MVDQMKAEELTRG